jgi:hypothetical protein
MLKETVSPAFLANKRFFHARQRRRQSAGVERKPPISNSNSTNVLIAASALRA